MKGIKRLTAIALSLVLMISALPFNAVTVAAADGVRTIDALSLTDLNSSISGYETALSNLSDPSYNMKSSYENYVYALAVKDVADYGSLNTQSTVDGAGFTHNMTKWNAYTGTYQPRFGSTTVPSGTYKNVLWADGSSQTSFDIASAPEIKTSTAGVTYACKTWYYWPQTTLLYDGTTSPVMPITLTLADYEDNYNIHPEYIFLSSSNNTTSNFEMFQRWDGYTTVSGTDKTAYANWQALKFGWNTTNRSKPIGYNSSTSIGKNDNCLEVDQNPSNTNGDKFIKAEHWYGNTYYEYSKHDVSTLMKYTYKNYLRYKNTPSDTLTTINNVTFDVKYWMSVVKVKTENDESKLVNVTTPIRVVNYKKLIDKATDTKKSLWTETAENAVNGNYREGGYSAFMGDLDTIEFNPNSYFTSSNNYTGLCNKIDTVCSTLDAPSSATADTHQTDWNKLRTAEDQNDGKGKARDVYKAGNTKWTTSSWNTFKTAFENVLDRFDAVVNTGAKTFSYSSLTGSDATRLSEALDSAYTGLQERADFTQINNDAKADSVYNTKSAENYTYDSYLPFAQARKVVNDYAALSDAVKLNTAKDDVQADLTAAHNTLNTKCNQLVEINDGIIEAYEVYDKAVSVVNTEILNTDKYSPDSTGGMSGAVVTANEAAYHTVSDDDAELLGASEGTVLKRKAVTALDTVTANLLSDINGIIEEDSSYNSFSVTFVINKDGLPVSSNTETGIPFGALREYSLGDNFTEGEDTVKWTTTVTDGGGKNIVYGGAALNKKVSGNLTVTADITSAPESEGYIYKYYNANGKHVYSDTHSASDYRDFESIMIYVEMPMMTVTDWYAEVDETNKVVTVKAIYTSEGDISLTAQSGTIINSKNETVEAGTTVAYNKNFTVSYTGSNTFWAWAVKTGENKYTVASYSRNYFFYSHCSLEFVPIYKDGSNYYYETSDGAVAVTADTISSTPNNLFGYDSDGYIRKKLDIKAPFIGIAGKTTVDNTKCRAFCIVTEGASIDYTKVGIKYDKNGNDPVNKASTTIGNVLETGQYSVTLSNTSEENGKFRATVNYDFLYDISLDVMETTELV